MWLSPSPNWVNFVLFLVLLSLKTSAVNPGCECVRYTSTWGKEWGVFGSPDYPAGYPRGIRCLLYSFSAPPGFILQVHLDKVFLPPPTHNNACVDYLKLFVHVDEGGVVGVNENTPWTTLVCGEATNLSYHSSSRHLIIQFHSAPSTLPQPQQIAQYSFNGRYRFLNSSEFVSTGRLMTGTKCDYQFVGSESEGRFFSPHHPSTYPHNIRCAYHFYASLHKRVRIVLETVALQPGEYSCLNKTDVIRVIDGSSAKSSVIALICNTVNDYEILSSGPHLQVEFLANSENPGTGFRAIYQYVQVQLDSSLDNTRLSHSSDLLNEHDGLPQASTLVPQCNQVITSDAGRNGSFSSPNYPHYYTAKTQCRYVFIGHGKERVQIQFTDFSLYHPTENVEDGSSTPLTSHELLQIYLNGNRVNEKSGKQKRCIGADLLSVWIYSDGHLEKMLDLCGHNLPPIIMSNGHRLTLEFNGASSSNFARGFYANYAFLEDYGVKTGRQLRDYPCGFMFNSSEISLGTFSSPNYPGIYPRDTECHYFFYGLQDEHVVLTYTFFHVEGIPPCSEWTKSDYVEFSNFMPVDKSYGRKCGLDKEPFRVISDGHFFRVTFRSNDEYDGAGFEATFLFTNQINQFLSENDIRVETGASSSTDQNNPSNKENGGNEGTGTTSSLSSTKFIQFKMRWTLSFLSSCSLLPSLLMT